MKITRVIVVCFVVSCMCVMGVTAQSNETTEDNETEVISEIGNGVSIVDYETDFENGTIEITFDSESAKEVTVTEAIAQDGVERLKQETYTIDGTTTVKFDTEVRNNKIAVTANSGLGPTAIVESKPRGFEFTGTYSANQTMYLFVGGIGTGITGIGALAYKRRVDITSAVDEVFK